MMVECNSVNPPTELGRLTDAGGGEQRTKIKTLLYNECRSGKPHYIQRRCPMNDLSLAHSRYNCTYHIVFFAKYRS